MSDMMKISIEKNQTHSTVLMAGDIDLESSPKVREHLLDALEDKSNLHIDCSNITAIDSSGIATLIEAFQNAQRQKLDFKLVSVPENVMRVLQLARLDNVFPIES